MSAIRIHAEITPQRPDWLRREDSNLCTAQSKTAASRLAARGRASRLAIAKRCFAGRALARCRRGAEITGTFRHSEVRILSAPARQYGLCAVVSGCVRIADIPAG